MRNCISFGASFLFHGRPLTAVCNLSTTQASNPLELKLLHSFRSLLILLQSRYVCVSLNKYSQFLFNCQVPYPLTDILKHSRLTSSLYPRSWVGSMNWRLQATQILFCLPVDGHFYGCAGRHIQDIAWVDLPKLLVTSTIIKQRAIFGK